MNLKSFLSGAQATPPAAPSSPSVGWPTAGVPGTTPTTVPGPYWFYQQIIEQHAILQAAGITPDAGNLTQLKQALDALYAPLGYVATALGNSSQTCQDKTASRDIAGSVFTNSSGACIECEVDLSQNGSVGAPAYYDIYRGPPGSLAPFYRTQLGDANGSNFGPARQLFTFVVPNGWQYKIVYATGAGATLNKWTELR